MTADQQRLLERIARAIERQAEQPFSRRIVQLAVGHGPEETVYALCNDGSVWLINDTEGWTQLPDIPQD